MTKVLRIDLQHLFAWNCIKQVFKFVILTCMSELKDNKYVLMHTHTRLLEKHDKLNGAPKNIP